jgi:hypothetical protein
VSPLTTLFVSRYDITPPTNPADIASVPPLDSDAWQGDVNDPVFVWNPAQDAGSGVMNYDISWSTEENTFAAAETVPMESFDPGPVDHLEVRYLGIRTRDQVGNVSDWEQKFVFRYDRTLPGNPNAATEENGVQSGVWQNLVPDPSFIWSGATGGEGSQVTLYDVYWGTDQAGDTVTESVTEQGYDPPALVEPSATYFLRVRTHNDAGKVSNWTTLFVFRYDSLPPDAILQVVESQGASSGVWQKNVDSPQFEWMKPSDQGDSGIHSYEISWLASATATVSVTSTTQTRYAPGKISAASPIHYLRLRSRDVAGNSSDWSLPLFVFQYDAVAPSNPDTVTETSGVLPGVWQNFQSAPTFTWSGSEDGVGSGIKDYRVFWGVIPDAEAAVATTANPSYSAGGPIQDGTWYLRLSARDQLDNATAWETAFVFLYDSLAPSNPERAFEARGARNGIVQSAVNNPVFSWPVPTDRGGSRVDHYLIYWGLQADGEIVHATKDQPHFEPMEVGGAQDLYLRVRTVDGAGNLAPEWKTLFEFKYDPTIPNLPPMVAEMNGAQDDQWQTSIPSPDFMWSGATGGIGAEITSYDLYFGTDSQGEEVMATVSGETHSFETPPGDHSGGYTGYFRMRVHDSLGAQSPWGTLFTFEYDPAAPSSTIEAVSAETLFTSKISIPWQGSDPEGGSGLAGVLVWYNKDNGGWMQYGPVASASPAILDTEMTGGDGTYQYYLLAVDVAGNLEENQDPTHTVQVLGETVASYFFNVSAAWLSRNQDKDYDPTLDLTQDQIIDWTDVIHRIQDAR